MSAAATLPVRMSVAEFLDWDPEDARRWQLVDGEPMAMAPANTVHALLQAELGRRISNHLLASGLPCNVFADPGVVPATMSAHNMRVPDLAVSCSPVAPGQAALTDPMLIAEILSPGNRAETWSNVWTYTAIPSVQEILVLHANAIGGELWHRLPDGTWPAQPSLAKDMLELACIGFSVPLADLYARTPLRGAAPS